MWFSPTAATRSAGWAAGEEGRPRLRHRAAGHVRRAQDRGISAIRETRASLANAGDAGSLVDELTRLAGLLDQGLLTRDEFDQLKARLIAGH
jgi:Short C-terminal domain